MPKAVTCIGNSRGFRRDGIYFPAGYWTILDEVTEAQASERHLRILDVSGPADPALAPLPVIVPGAEDAIHPATPVAALAEEAERLRGEVAELQSQLEGALAEIKQLKAAASSAEKAARQTARQTAKAAPQGAEPATETPADGGTAPPTDANGPLSDAEVPDSSGAETGGDQS